ncbi:MAG: MFS transporter [Phenylobacterium sp.]
MAAIEAGAAPRRAVLGGGVVFLLALSVFINYVDRGNLATAGPVMKDQLGLSATQLGLLLSVFYWTYTPGQILAGWLGEKINPYRALALGLAIWSLATLLTGLASTFTILIGLRLLLGLGESVAFPCSSKLLGEHLAPHKSSHANALIAAGLALGPAFGTYFGGMLLGPLGWRGLFIIFGVASMAWLVPWMLSTRTLSAQADAATDTGTAPAFFTILARREAWGACLGHFCNNYAFYFVVSWLPTYLVKAQGFSVTRMAQVGGAVYLIYAASSLATGWLSDRWFAAGGTPNRVRKTFLVAGHTLAAAALIVCAVGDQLTCLAGLAVAAVAFGFNTASLYAAGQTIAGPRASGKWIAVQNCAGNVAGLLAPLLTGVVVDRTGQFTWAFVTAGAITLMGVLAWGVVIPKVAPLIWPARTTAA